jgi:EAL domain-containing protein (putative c-di-GMP-specific phosphodiesterase class I)
MSPPFADVEVELHDALQRGALELLYQPVVDLHDATIGAVESLLRWRHERGLIAAGLFLPEVTDPALYEAIADFAFEAAAQQLSLWRRRFDSWLFPVSVNVAATDFDDRLVKRIVDLRARHEFPPGAIAIDIAEPVLLADLERGRTLVLALKGAGAQIVVDDFGTTRGGAAHATDDVVRSPDDLLHSLAALEAFPVDVLKVDRELIGRSFAETLDVQVVESIVRLAHLFGFRLLAEGVETGDEAEWLRQAGFDLGQGYYFQRPHGPGHIDRLLIDLADARRAFATASRTGDR